MTLLPPPPAVKTPSIPTPQLAGASLEEIEATNRSAMGGAKERMKRAKVKVRVAARTVAAHAHVTLGAASAAEANDESGVVVGPEGGKSDGGVVGEDDRENYTNEVGAVCTADKSLVTRAVPRLSSPIIHETVVELPETETHQARGQPFAVVGSAPSPEASLWTEAEVATSVAPRSGSDSLNGLGTEVVLVFYTAIVAAYQGWASKSSILANRIPLSVVFPFIVMAFLSGYSLDNYLWRSGERSPNQASHRQRSRGWKPFSDTDDDGAQRYVANMDENGDENDDCDDENMSRMKRAKRLARRGKNHVKLFGRKYIKKSTHIYPNTNNGGGVRRGQKGPYKLNKVFHNHLFFSSLSPPDDIKEWERALKAPFSEGPLMDHLLNYADFRRYRKSTKKTLVKGGNAEHNTEDNSGEAGAEADDTYRRTEAGAYDEHERRSEAEVIYHERGGTTAISVGHARLKNTRAELLEADRQFAACLVDPLCDLRGMDLFLTDDPEEEVWRQPLLNQCGLRDAPTFISNMMMPFGNMTAYFKLPDWFDDWDTIPKEKDDDPPDIKAFKRFLVGNDDYRNARAKVIPFVVDGPLAIRLIKPKPMEVNIDGPYHPAKWKNVPKSVDPATGRTSAALLECDIDLFSVKAIRKVINIVRPHVQSITIDVAIIISKPNSSEVDEPCACLGLWRIEKVDFESCAVFPELGIEDAAEEVKVLMSQMDKGDTAEVSG